MVIVNIVGRTESKMSSDAARGRLEDHDPENDIVTLLVL